jgi:hypothetical protein
MIRLRLLQLHAAWHGPLLQPFLLLLAIGAIWLYATHPGVLLAIAWASYGTLLFVLATAGYRMTDGALGWRFRRDWVEPLAVALRPLLDVPDIIPGKRFLSIPRDFGTNPKATIVVNLPAHFVGTDDDEEGSGKGPRKKIAFVVLEKLGLKPGDVNVFWVMSGRWHYLQVTLKEKLTIPAKVAFADVRHLIEQCEPGRHLLAVGKSAAGVELGEGEKDDEAQAPALITGNLDGEAPHVGLSMRTGGGKSNQIKGIVAQEMHHGASVDILDYKRRSLKCFKGVAGVTYCRDIGEIHNDLLALAREAMERNVLADELDDDQEPPWQRRLIVVEEQNSMLRQLRRYWDQVRESHEPKSSPAIDAYEELLFMGRQVKFNVIASFQKLTVRAAGSTEARDQFGMIIMSLFKPSSWKMLADELPMPKIAGKPRGRSWYVFAGEAPEGQPVLWTDKQAREWAASGQASTVRTLGGRGSRGLSEPVSQGKHPASLAGTGLQLLPGGAGEEIAKLAAATREPQLYTLSQLSSDRGHGFVKATYHTLRNQRVTSNSEFPAPDKEEGQAKLYHPETVQRWERNRESAGATS